MASLTDKKAQEGETVSGTFAVSAAVGAVSVRFAFADGTEAVDATVTDGTAAVSFTPSHTGRARWVALGTDTAGNTAAVANGTIYVCPLRSKWRDYLEACEAALASYASNANKAVTVGELSITYKDAADLQSLISYYRDKAEKDEAGIESTGGPLKIYTRFTR